VQLVSYTIQVGLQRWLKPFTSPCAISIPQKGGELPTPVRCSVEQVRLARNAKAYQCVRTADRADQIASQHIRTAGSLPCIPVFTAGLNAVDSFPFVL